MVFRWLIPISEHGTYLVVLSSIGVTAVLWLVVVLLTPPDPRDVLVRFYERARPPGWWGPITAEVAPRRRRGLLVPVGFGIAALGLVAVAGGVLALSSAYVGRWVAVAASAGVCVVASLVFRGLLDRFLRRWEADGVESPAAVDSRATRKDPGKR